jgi:hypothetical protein
MPVLTQGSPAVVKQTTTFFSLTKTPNKVSYYSHIVHNNEQNFRISIAQLSKRLALPFRFIPRKRKEDCMATEKDKLSTAESLRQTRTYGKFRCHNPSCMGRLQPQAGDKTVKCPVCGMEFRVHWIRPDFPRIRGPVWDVNRRIAEEALAKKEGK